MERFKTFTVLIASISRSIRKIKTEEMAKWNLKSHHVSCIYYLYEKKRLTAKELCDICEEDKANISRSIEDLEERGYLRYESHNEKRYKTHFALTEKGNVIGENIHSRIEAIISQASNALSEDNRKIMYESLALINNNLQKVYDEYKK